MTRKRTNKKQALVVSVPSRQIASLTRLLLFVRAGGRCQFDGCNEYLLEHPVTLTEGNFGQLAHIVAFSKEGPRGEVSSRPRNINDVNNLMLLCPICHKLIDDHPEQYTVATLEKYKTKHEDRIRHVTGLGPDLKTTVVQLKTRVAGQSVAIPISQVTEAVSPRYPTDARGYVIDLTDLNAEEAAFLSAATENIKREIERLYAPGMDIERTRHISLFALAPIPLLVFLGSQLSNKIPVEIYQRHRNTEDWVWKEDGESVDYKFEKLRSGNNPKNVALLLSLSGKISLDSLPAGIDDSFSVYEITLTRKEPSPTYLRLRQDAINFKEIYQAALRAILRDHGNLERIHLFPAVPAPIAVLCGRELLPKVDPGLLVYDNDKRKGGFTFALRVN
jgi:SMODS-associated and fused to various effectors sensor domain/HNH endonuclease